MRSAEGAVMNSAGSLWLVAQFPAPLKGAVRPS
jgi:hypothetical protein